MGLTLKQAILKRIFDVVCAFFCLSLTWWIIILAWMVATIDTRQNGFFIQQRVGRYGRLFNVIKIRTMRKSTDYISTITTSKDPRITSIGRILRKTKIDELPQIINVLIGDMSFVGPRPDVPGFADKLTGSDRRLLTIRPGITGPATLKYRNEEEFLANSEDPEAYNNDVIFPDKVKINLEYIENWKFTHDLRYLWYTAFGN